MKTFWKYASYSVLICHIVITIVLLLMPLLISIGKWRGLYWTEISPLHFAHISVLTFIAFEVSLRIPCPLTLADNFCGIRAGMPIYEQGFFDYWVEHILKIDCKNWMFDAVFFLLFIISLTQFLQFILR